MFFFSLSPEQMPGGSHNIKITLVIASDIIKLLSVQHLQVCCNHLTPDVLGKSSHVVIHCEVSASQLHYVEMWPAAVNSQVVLI